MTGKYSAIPVFRFVCLMADFLFQERDQLYLSRLYLAKHEIAALAVATELFHQKYGSYPSSLQQLVNPTSDGSREQLLPRIGSDPWGGHFTTKLSVERWGNALRVWVVPDAKTQHRLGIVELSNKTDWQAILK